MISVIVPVYNSARWLPDVIQALTAQDWTGEYEILMVDNASTDKSSEILQANPRVRYLREEKRGSYAARNHAAREARGQILAFTDADRVVRRDWLRRIHEAFEATPAQVLLGNSRPAKEGGLKTLLADYENAKSAYSCQLAESPQQIAYTGNMAVRRATFDRYGPFVELQRGGDVVFARRVVDGEPHGAMCHCPEMVDVHLEFDSSQSYFRKLHTYGRSICTYGEISGAQPLNLDDRIRIFLRCVQEGDYGTGRALALAAGLALGLVAYEAGRWAGGGQRTAAPERPPEAVAQVDPRKALPPSVSVVVEWENVLLAGDDRGEGALERIAQETQRLPEEVRREVIVVYAPEEVDGSALDQLVKRFFPAGGARLVAGPPDYYELKNAGAREAAGGIVVFSDSDTHVEPGWLTALLQPFADPAVAAVAGSSYLEPTTFLSRAFALFWFFPLRAKDGPIQPAKGIFANNFAVRREIFLREPFRHLEGLNRGACVVWRERMLAQGWPVMHNPKARTAHPPPNGGVHFFVRALTHGRDALLLARRLGRRVEGGVTGTLLRLGLNFGRTSLHGWSRRSAAGLRWWEAVPAVLTGYTYYVFYFAGEVMTYFWPAWMSRRFRI